MKNFKLLWAKKVKTEFGKAAIRCYYHMPTNNLLYSHAERWDTGEFWHTWTNRIDKGRAMSSASLKFWVDYFYKHPITLSNKK